MGTMKELSEDLETKKFAPIYIFTGEEDGLIHQYLTDIKKVFKNVVESESIDTVIEDTKYNPIFGDKKLFIIRDSGLFNKIADEKFINFLVRMFKQTMNVCIFVEKETNKTLKQTQSIAEKNIIEFKKLSEVQLVALVSGILTANGKKLVKDVIRYVVDQCDYDYNTVMNEITKLVNYSDKKEITIDEVKQVVTQSTRSIVFDLIDFIVKQKYARAVDMFNTLMLKKEQPLVILTLIYRQLKLIYQINLLKTEGYNTNDIAEACDSKPFIIEKTMHICNFETEKLVKLLLKCSDYDYKIKTGQIGDRLAIECLILYSSLKTK